MLFDLIVIIIIARFLKRALLTSELTREWNKRLTYLMVTASALFVCSIVIKNTEHVFEWIGHALAWILLWLVFSKKEWSKAKPLLYATLPLLAINTISDTIQLIVPSFYQKWENYFDAASLFGFVWLIAMLIVNNKQRKALQKERIKVEEKEREIKITERIKATLEVQVQERTAEILKQKEELQHALDELKNTQTQLIHAEKMASLGELTAGIAHEIQNPLNFVNNFSEVNKELIEELKSEKSKGKNERDGELEIQLLNDIEQNLAKITHHGKRADAIVKGMLQHSRTTSGQKEPTDINALCDEYLRLAYHGLRAKDKSFHAKYEMHFDNSIEQIDIVPQEIGRVILNVVNNAFQAVSEKQKAENFHAGPSALTLNGDRYEPLVIISTKRLNGKVEISVKDNGNGIPDLIKEKIFQPFFTTKPTGQGTGLGLSLAYDIIKAQGGEIKVESRSGEWTEFVISLPMN